VFWQFVAGFPEERLTLRSAPLQGEEPDRTSRERDLGTDETMRPVPVNREDVAEQRGSALGVRPAEVEHLAAHGARGVELPRRRDRAPGGRLRAARELPRCRAAAI
jgi:hypothetical protein